MKKFDLGQVANTIANVGVVIGIVFLVLELRQNNELLELEAYRTFTDRAVGNIDAMIYNPRVVEVALTDPALFTPEQKFLQWQMAIRTFLIMEEQFELILVGRITPEEVISSWRTIFWNRQNSFGMPEYWDSYKPRARSEFVTFFDNNIVAPGPPD